MQDIFAAAQDAVAISIGSVAVFGMAAGSCTLAAWWLLKRMTADPPGKYINRVWVSGHDLRAFAGFEAAVDPQTDELMAVASSYEALSAEMHRHHRERDWVPVSIPGERCKSLDRLLPADKE